MHGRFTVSGRCITTPEVGTRTGLLQSHISQVGFCVATPLQIVKSNGRVYQKNMTLFKTDPLKSILVEGLSNLQSLKSLYSEFKLPYRQFYRPFIAYYVYSQL